MYLTMAERRSMFEGIAALLRQHGGMWSCPDMCAGPTYGRMA